MSPRYSALNQEPQRGARLGRRNAAQQTYQSVRHQARGFAADARRAAGRGRRAVDAGVLELPLGRYRLPLRGAVEQRSAGMAADRNLRATGALQRMQHGVQHCVVAAELGVELPILVIPGRARLARARNPLARKLCSAMDSGLVLRTPRNDERGKLRRGKAGAFPSRAVSIPSS